MNRLWLGLTAAAIGTFLGAAGDALAQGTPPPAGLSGMWLLTFSGTAYDAQGAKTKVKETVLVSFADTENGGLDVGPFGAGPLSFPPASGERLPNAFFAEGAGASLACRLKVDSASGEGVSCKGIATWGPGGSVAMLKVKGKRVLFVGPPTSIFAHDFEAGLAPYVETDAAGAAQDTLWHGEALCGIGAPIPAAMGSLAAGYNRGDENPPVYTYNTGSTTPNQGAIEGPLLPISAQTFGITIRFDMLQETENQPAFFDQAFLEVKSPGDPSWQTVAQILGLAGCGQAPLTVTIGPSDPVLNGVIGGGGLLHRFQFDTVDSGVNNFLGWYVDNVQIEVQNATSIP